MAISHHIEDHQPNATSGWAETSGSNSGAWQQTRRPAFRKPSSSRPQATSPDQIDAQVAAADRQLDLLHIQLTDAIGHTFRVEDIAWLRKTSDPKFARAQVLLAEHARWSLLRTSLQAEAKRRRQPGFSREAERKRVADRLLASSENLARLRTDLKTAEAKWEPVAARLRMNGSGAAAVVPFWDREARELAKNMPPLIARLKQAEHIESLRCQLLTEQLATEQAGLSFPTSSWEAIDPGLQSGAIDSSLHFDHLQNAISAGLYDGASTLAKLGRFVHKHTPGTRLRQELYGPLLELLGVPSVDEMQNAAHAAELAAGDSALASFVQSGAYAAVVYLPFAALSALGGVAAESAGLPTLLGQSGAMAGAGYAIGDGQSKSDQLVLSAMMGLMPVIYRMLKPMPIPARLGLAFATNYAAAYTLTGDIEGALKLWRQGKKAAAAEYLVHSGDGKRATAQATVAILIYRGGGRTRTPAGRVRPLDEDLARANRQAARGQERPRMVGEFPTHIDPTSEQLPPAVASHGGNTSSGGFHRTPAAAGVGAMPNGANGSRGVAHTTRLSHTARPSAVAQAETSGAEPKLQSRLSETVWGLPPGMEKPTVLIPKRKAAHEAGPDGDYRFVKPGDTNGDRAAPPRLPPGQSAPTDVRAAKNSDGGDQHGPVDKYQRALDKIIVRQKLAQLIRRLKARYHYFDTDLAGRHTRGQILDQLIDFFYHSAVYPETIDILSWCRLQDVLGQPPQDAIDNARNLDDCFFALERDLESYDVVLNAVNEHGMRREQLRHMVASKQVKLFLPTFLAPSYVLNKYRDDKSLAFLEMMFSPGEDGSRRSNVFVDWKPPLHAKNNEAEMDIDEVIGLLHSHPQMHAYVKQNPADNTYHVSISQGASVFKQPTWSHITEPEGFGEAFVNWREFCRKLPFLYGRDSLLQIIHLLRQIQAAIRVGEPPVIRLDGYYALEDLYMAEDAAGHAVSGSEYDLYSLCRADYRYYGRDPEGAQATVKAVLDELKAYLRLRR